jgi:ADP-L-glycero-D-manno-heptose 6-epimerase
MPIDLGGKYQYFTEAPMAKLRQAGYDRAPTPLEQGVKSYVRWLEENPWNRDLTAP